MNNLYKSAGSMFAFSNAKNKMDSALPVSRVVFVEGFEVVNKSRVNEGAGNLASSRPLEFHD